MTKQTCQECGKETTNPVTTCPDCRWSGTPTSQTHALHLTYNRLISGILFWGGVFWLVFNAISLDAVAFNKGLKWAGGTMTAGVLYYLIVEITGSLAEKKTCDQDEQIKTGSPTMPCCGVTRSLVDPRSATKTSNSPPCSQDGGMTDHPASDNKTIIIPGPDPFS